MTSSRPVANDDIGSLRVESGGPTLRVVLAEDDDEMRRLIAWALERDGCCVEQLADGRALHVRVCGPRDVDDESVDLVVSDLRMPFSSGLDILRALRRSGNVVPFILLSAFGDEETRAEAEGLSALFLVKPFDLVELRQSVRQMVPHS